VLFIRKNKVFFFSSFFVHVEVKTVSLSKQNTVGIIVLRSLQVVLHGDRSLLCGHARRALKRFIFSTSVKKRSAISPGSISFMCSHADMPCPSQIHVFRWYLRIETVSEGGDVRSRVPFELFRWGSEWKRSCENPKSV